MGTSGTESFEGCLWTKLKPLPPQPTLKLSLVRLKDTEGTEPKEKEIMTDISGTMEIIYCTSLGIFKGML